MACYYYLMFTICVAGQTVANRICEDGQYLDIKADTCLPCSTRCPDNQVVRQTCGLYSDIECGPLVELSEFFKDLSRENSQKSKKSQLDSEASTDIRVASVKTDAHENASLVHVLLVVLLFLTGLIIVLTAVALVMYRRRNSHVRKIDDPENEVCLSKPGEVLTARQDCCIPDGDRLVLVTDSLKPEP